MTEKPLTEAEQLDAALEKLIAERTRRRLATGKWVMPVVVIDNGEQVSASSAEESPPQWKNPPELMEIHVIHPRPVVELPTEQWEQPVDARDVTPPRPPTSPRSARSLPPAPGAGALSVDPRNVNIPPSIYSAEQRRTRNFNDDTWGDPAGWPIRYPRGNRGGW